ncbi:transporter substrate-binding domain-containing protein [Clostridioides difficile]|nr:amino acid ABC transporter substrate-binding protein [Clostridioides difficile]
MYWKRALSILTVGVVICGLAIGCSKKEEPKKEEKKVITVATGAKYYPFNFREDGKMQGFEIDIWNEIGKRLDSEVKYEVNNGDTGGLLGMVDSGKADTAAQQISVTPEREEVYDFTVPYAYNPLMITIRPEDKDKIKNLEDLKGKKVEVGANSSERAIMEEKNKDNSIELVFNDGADSYEGLELGRSDARIISVSATAARNKKAGSNFIAVGEPIYEEINAYPFRKDEKSKELKAKVDEAITAMRKDGALTEISKKWFGEDITVEK